VVSPVREVVVGLDSEHLKSTVTEHGVDEFTHASKPRAVDVDLGGDA
jgi:hypothetical protein